LIPHSELVLVLSACDDAHAGDSHDVRYPNIDTRELLVTTYVREARQQVPFSGGTPICSNPRSF
jgi:hypothetical protein